MSLTVFTGTIVSSVLNGNFDDKTATITSQALEGQKDHVVFHRRASLAAADDVSLRCVDFTPQDDLEVRVLRVTVNDTAGTATITATLTQTDGDAVFLLDQTVSVSVAAVVGTAHGNSDLRTATGTRLRLLKGVSYRLTLSTTGTVTWAQVSLVLRSRRRSA